MESRKYDSGFGRTLYVAGFVYRKKMCYSTYCMIGKSRPFRLKRQFEIHNTRDSAQRELDKYAKDCGLMEVIRVNEKKDIL